MGKDASCNYSGTTVHYCDYGLYCATTGGPGVCRVAKKIGDSCGGAWDSSCGFGNTCRDLKCQVGAAKGMSCGGGAADLQCASWNCDGGMCTDPYVQLAIPLLCSGAAG